MKDFGTFLDMKRCKNLAHKMYWKYLPKWRLFCQLSQSTDASFLNSPMDSFQRILKVRSCSPSWFNSCGGGWKVPIFSWQLHKVFETMKQFDAWDSNWQRVRTCLKCRRPRFDPWLEKIPWRRKWHPLQSSCLENPMDRGAWWATGHRVPKSRTGLSDQHLLT